MVDDVHLLAALLVVAGAVDEAVVGELQQFVDIAQTGHLLLHPQQQLLLSIPELLRLELHLLESLLQSLPVLVVLLHYGEELLQRDLY